MSATAGVLNQISLEKEGTYGTPATPSLSVPVNKSDGVKIQQEVLAVEAIKGSVPKNKAFYKGKTSYEGGYELGAYPKVLGLFLLSAFGSVQDSTVESGAVYKHTFTESAVKTGLTIEQMNAGIVKRFAGFIVNKLKISGKVGDLILATVTGVAKSAADATAISKTYEASQPFNWANVKTLSIGGTDIKEKVQSFEVEYDNAVEMLHGLGNADPQTYFAKGSILKGKIEAYVDATTLAYLADMIAVTEREIIIELEGATTIGSASKYDLKLTISKCVFQKFDTKIDEDYNALTLEFEAREDATNGLIKAELTNITASY